MIIINNTNNQLSQPFVNNNIPNNQQQQNNYPNDVPFVNNENNLYINSPNYNDNQQNQRICAPYTNNNWGYNHNYNNIGPDNNPSMNNVFQSPQDDNDEFNIVRFCLIVFGTCCGCCIIVYGIIIIYLMLNPIEWGD